MSTRAIVLAFVTGVLHAQEPAEPHVLRIVEIGAARTDLSVEPMPPLPPMVRQPYEWGDMYVPLLEQLRDVHTTVDIDQLVDLAATRYPEAWDRLSIDTRPGGAFVRGPESRVTEVADFLEWANARLARTVTVEVLVYGTGTAPLPGRDVTPLLEQGDPSSMVGGLPLLWRQRATVPLGAAVVLGRGTMTPIVDGWNLDLAEGVALPMPRIGSMFEGDRVAVAVEALPSDEAFVVYAQTGHGERRGGTGEGASGPMAAMRIDTPRIDVIAATMAGRVPDGGNLWCWTGGDATVGGGRAVVVRIQENRAGEPSRPGCAILPIGGLTRSGIDVRMALRLSEERPRGLPLAWLEEGVTAPLVMDPDELVSLVHQAIEAHRERVDPDGERDSCEIMSIASSLIVIGAEDEVAIARSVLAEIEKRAIRPVTVRLISQHPAGDGERPVHGFLLPHLVGRPLLALRGIESLGIHDLVGMVAVNASSALPQVWHRFSGVVCSLDVLPTSEGLFVDADIQHVIEQDLRPRPFSAPPGAEQSVPPALFVDFLHRASITLGTPVEFGGAVSGDGLTQTMELR